MWILASNADTKPTWNMDLLNEIGDNFEEYHVQAFLMISDLYPRLSEDQEGQKFMVPQIIMITPESRGQDLR